MPSCHITPLDSRGADFTIALAGNPNVGKSSLFNYLTGASVDTANYPGKTVALNFGMTQFQGKRIGVVDLPGTYALSALSEDQWVARQAVLEDHPNAVVVITDATNLERTLYLVLQYMDLGLPLVIAVNLIDEAKRAGIEIDTERLSAALHTPVVPTIATCGEGIPQLLTQVAFVPHAAAVKPPAYDSEIEAAIAGLGRAIRASLSETPFGLAERSLAILLLEEDAWLVKTVADLPGGATVLGKAREFASEAEAHIGEPLAMHIPRARHGLAHALSADCQVQRSMREPLSIKLWHASIEPLTGIPILIGVMIALFAFLFRSGETLGALFGAFWETLVSPPIQALVHLVLGQGPVARIALWGVDAGIKAALQVGIPYVLTFYAALAILEDSGYMNSIAFLLDSLMKRLGLHGRAAIMLLAAAGCNVPAVMGTRVLRTRRERIIASTLVILMPCSARTSVIIGGLAVFAGWQYGAALFVLALGLLALTGMGLNLVMPGHSDDLVMEMFPFRVPTASAVLRKTWNRFKEFVLTAMPVVLIGSIVMGALYETNLIWQFAKPIAPIVEGWLGLPAVAGLTLIVAVLRKELALQFLVTLAVVQYGSGAANLLAFMTSQQLFVYALVNTVYLPCIATFAVLNKELGTRAAIGIAAFTIVLAILVGGLARYAMAIL